MIILQSYFGLDAVTPSAVNCRTCCINPSSDARCALIKCACKQTPEPLCTICCGENAGENPKCSTVFCIC
ncbi:hypothetical protein O3M35_006983 [Rhynocoris fuscipes]|uniref:Uncharacterized protein n=1 Tax=Rhynocoris fuscipes TaxID=488301 RepID=A0AAW1DHV1_9HEMI